MNSSAIFQNIKTFIARYTLQQKLSIVFAAGLVIVLTWGLIYFVNRVNYQVLYSDVDPAEAQVIVTKLQSAQVPYELSEDGRTIRVASEKIAEIRMQLASEGLPDSGSPGLDGFNQPSFGTTSFQEEVKYQQAMQGELVRSIRSLKEVEKARVHLVLPKESLYEKPEEQTKASVFLKLKSGRTLPESGVQAIAHLVASSVKGLTPERVTIVDYRGKLLSHSESENSMTGQQLTMQRKIEADLVSKIVQIVEPTVGVGKVKPQVSAVLNFQQIDEIQQNVDPKSPVIVSAQRQTDPGSVSSLVGGIVGVKTPSSAAAAATQSQPGAAAGGTPAVTAGPIAPTPPTVNAGRQSEIVNYDFSKSTRHIVSEVGKLERLSVAVVLDSQTETQTAGDGKVSVKTTPRTKEEMEKYYKLIAAAIGINADRGDTLIVENTPFDNDTAAEGIKEPTFVEKQMPSILTALRFIIIPIAFILIYFLFIRPVQKSVMAGWTPVPVGGPAPRALLKGGVQTPLTVQQMEARLASGNSASLENDLDAVGQDLLPLPGPTRADMIRQRVVEQAEQNPENIARLVRVWLNDEKKK